VTSAAENQFLVSSFDFAAFKDQLAIAWLGGLVSTSGIGTRLDRLEGEQPEESGYRPASDYSSDRRDGYRRH
jgi:hypothetical protein